PDLSADLYGERPIHDHRSWRVAVVEGCRIDERFECRARLAHGLSGAIELRLGERKAADHRQHTARMRVHGNQSATDAWDLAKTPFRTALFLALSIDDVARLQHLGRGTRLDASSVDSVAQRPLHIGSLDRARLTLFGKITGNVTCRPDADGEAGLAGFEHDRELPFRRIAERRDLVQQLAPIAGNVDLIDTSVEAAQRVITDQAGLERLARIKLQIRVERRANGQATFIKRVFAVAGNDLTANLLGE